MNEGMKSVAAALLAARQEIKATKMKKGGKNKFSNYDYFTPEQVDKLAHDAAANNGLITLFNLERNEYGVVGTLQVYHIESGESVIFKQVTDIPEIKATNIAQKMGGMVTYTERYLTMTAFGIKDNSLDFDADKEQKPNPAPKPKEKKKVEADKAQAVADWAISKGKSLDDVKKVYDLSTEAEKIVKEVITKVKNNA